MPIDPAVPVLETERLCLTLEHWQANADKVVEQWRAGTAVKFSVLTHARDEVVGTVSLFDLRRQIWQNGSLGYALAARHQGQGLMSEAVRAATVFAFETLGLHRVEANYREDNARSARLLARLGFHIEGRRREASYADGRWWDSVVTSLLAPTP